MTDDQRPSRACCGLAPTPPAEDALRTIFVLAGRGDPVTTSALAARLDVTPPTVSSMLKRLAEHGLLDRTDSRPSLTAHGERHARHVVRRHRLLETFLVEVLGLGVDEVHDEADALEHAVSDRVLERIDALLGRPPSDPHGDPIPRAGTGHVERCGRRLADADPPGRFTVQRVHDWDSGALAHLTALGIRPGAVVEVLDRGPYGGPLRVRVAGREHALGDPLTRLVHGEPGAGERA